MSVELPFAVAVLAGGRSSRMGRDKALLVHEGRTLLQRQVDLAWSLEPQEVFVVGRPQPELGALRARGLSDDRPGLGPLGGLATVLAAAAAPHVLVLAVDMPALTPGFLRRLLAGRRAGLGLVARTARGWEPMLGLYPTALARMAAEAVAAGRLGFGRLVEQAVHAGMLGGLEVGSEEQSVLENWNAPGDLPASGAAAKQGIGPG